MGYVDGELTKEEVEEIESHLQMCARCRSELEEYRKLDRVTSAFKFVVPEDEIWKGYWSRVYNRVERDTGWILLSIGLAILIFFGSYRALNSFLEDPSVPVMMKVGTGAVIVGLVVLVLSILRERLFFYRRQRYKDIRR
jgi:predicted anti-sigma-YlaC factor YlaD